MYAKKIDVGYLTTHVFPLEETKKAYDMMMEKSEPFIGILIEYDVKKDIRIESRVDIKASKGLKVSTITIGFLGAGSYAQSHLLPNLPNRKVALKGVVTTAGSSARSVAERFGFEFASTDASDVLGNDEINTVFIASRHDSHAGYVTDALRAGKNVFVEKPLCLNESELEEIGAIYQELGHDAPILMVGYNRRFAELAEMLKGRMGQGPMSMLYRVNAGKVPADSWVQDLEIGGGRITGEVCHFVDFLTWINGSLPVSVYAAVMKEPNNLNDVVTISLSYANGSIGNICYFANGDKGLPKERIEIHAHGNSAVLDDFKTGQFYMNGKKKEKKLLSQNKGQKTMITLFCEAILKGKEQPVPFAEILNTSLTTFKIGESIRTGKCLPVVL